ncbi:MAG: tRNA (adenosine(37)-N6)-dimethylallyltransferase MiaA [Proteobacteria bacterium]|nr:tRNA (adenosine(37)-N6)-dimethylallyltransferase MiaA [Pseudomonadota bacterium]
MDPTCQSPPIVCLMGPTACGKTDLAIALTQYFPFEIISVDSAQIYQGMDIGSAKPSLAIRSKVPHHLMDFLDPAMAYSAAQFRQDAIHTIKSIQSRNRIPLLVGGTMLYFKVLQQGISNLPQGNPNFRALLEEKAKLHGWEALHEELARLDKDRALKIKPTDSQRIQRALEVIALTGQSMSHWYSKPKDPIDFNFINIGLLPIQTARMALHERIQKRFTLMLQQGLVTEVKTLMLQGLNLALPSMRAVGYRQVWQFLSKEITYIQMQEKAVAATRQLAKRQLTWLRHWPQLTSFDFCETALLTQIIQHLHNKIK